MLGVLSHPPTLWLSHTRIPRASPALRFRGNVLAPIIVDNNVVCSPNVGGVRDVRGLVPRGASAGSLWHCSGVCDVFEDISGEILHSMTCERARRGGQHGEP